MAHSAHNSDGYSKRLKSKAKKCASANDENHSQKSYPSATQNSFGNDSEIRYEPVLDTALTKKTSAITDGRPPRSKQMRAKDSSGLDSSNNLTNNSLRSGKSRDGTGKVRKQPRALKKMMGSPERRTTSQS